MRKKGTGAYLRKYEEFHPKNSGQISRCAICVNSTSVRKAMILKAKYKILTVSFREGESATSHCSLVYIYIFFSQNKFCKKDELWSVGCYVT